MNLKGIKKSIMYRLHGGAYGERMNIEALKDPEVAAFYKKGTWGKIKGGFEITGKVMKTVLRRALGIEK